MGSPFLYSREIIALRRLAERIIVMHTAAARSGSGYDKGQRRGFIRALTTINQTLTDMGAEPVALPREETR